jgi:uncharacterized membrane protein YkoI
MTRRSGSALVILAALLVFSAPVVRAQDDDDEGDQTAVVKALSQAKVSLSQGLAAGGHEGTPISAKFELDDGKLQLSVYTMKADKFSEVAVDPVSGKVVNVETITEGEDLADAKSQSDAMKKAKRSLAAAIEEALKANKGYQAVSVIPSLKDGHAVAEVTLAKGEELKTVVQKLE